MPLIDGAASHIARDIERFAVSCPSSQGEVWHATTDLILERTIRRSRDNMISECRAREG